MEANPGTKTRTGVIDTFLKENGLKSTDLVQYLKLNHGFDCYRDTQSKKISKKQLYEQLRIKMFLMRLEEEISLNETKKITK